MLDIWNWFRDLSATRQSNNSPGPITYLEIGAYDKEMLIGMPVWAKRVIRRIDDAVLNLKAEELANLTKETKPRQPHEAPVHQTASFDDPQALKAYMNRLTAQQNARVAAARARQAKTAKKPVSRGRKSR